MDRFSNSKKAGVGTLAYKTKEEVMEWMLDIQLGRRNLTPIQKIAITEKYRPIYEKQAKENKQNAMMIARQNNENNKNEQFSQISSTTVDSKNKIDVRAKLAETAGVSTDTYSKGKKILNSNNEKLKQEVLSGEKSINAGYKELTGKKENQYIYNRSQIWEHYHITFRKSNYFIILKPIPKRKRSYSSQKYYSSHSVNRKQPYTPKERNQ